MQQRTKQANIYNRRWQEYTEKVRGSVCEKENALAVKVRNHCVTSG